ncbi:hypothetical protein [Streptosporangium sandarakinum]|uniref:hypothetical protein n=1 Tax=Streptosporangium sandarakinum TaxID=1260955 RepID=UPI0037B7F214
MEPDIGPVRMEPDRASPDPGRADAGTAVPHRADAGPAVPGGTAAARVGRGPVAPGRVTAGRAGVIAAAAVAGMLAATVTAALQWRTADRLRQEDSERAAVAARAREFAVALQTYDYADLRACRDRVRAVSSERFERTYDEVFARLRDAIISLRARSAASVRDVYVSGVTPERARAVTVVDSTVTSTAGTRRLLGTYMRLDLVRAGGRWEVDGTTVMGAADELVTDPQGRTVTPSPGPSGNAPGDDSTDDSGEDE